MHFWRSSGRWPMRRCSHRKASLSMIIIDWSIALHTLFCYALSCCMLISFGFLYFLDIFVVNSYSLSECNVCYYSFYLLSPPLLLERQVAECVKSKPITRLFNENGLSCSCPVASTFIRFSLLVIVCMMHADGSSIGRIAWNEKRIGGWSSKEH